MKLSEIQEGDVVTVIQISSHCAIARRLLDIGLIPGTKVECVLISPFQNPKAFLIRGAVIAIRNEDASMIEIQ